MERTDEEILKDLSLEKIFDYDSDDNIIKFNIKSNSKEKNRIKRIIRKIVEIGVIPADINYRLNNIIKESDDTIKEWQTGNTYNIGDKVIWQNDLYKCHIKHRADSPDWNPANLINNFWFKI